MPSHGSRVSDLATLQQAGLFWLAWLLGAFLAIYTPWQLWREAQTLRDAGSPAAALALGLLALLTVGAAVRWCVLLLLSYSRVRAPEADASTPLPFVSILMPAYKEADGIQSALDGLLALDYPSFEVIVVDDGSPDETWALAQARAGRYITSISVCDIRVFTKENGGKWSAHNFGLKRARGELILCIDADSRLDPQSLKRLVRRLDDPRVGAVSGQIRVRNRDRLLTRLQALEYVMANGAYRLAQGASGTVMVVPGPIGLFRRHVLDEVCHAFPDERPATIPTSWQGPFSDATFAEDFHLSLAILMLGYTIDYEPGAVSRTKSPATIGGLLNQRYRWTRGTIQVVRWFLRQRRERRVVPTRRLSLWVDGTLLFDTLVLPLIQIVLVLGLVLALLSGVDLRTLATWTASVCALNVIAGTFFLLAHDDDLSLLPQMPLLDLYHSVMLTGGWMIAAVDELRGARMRW